jgi:acyl-CoA synthetase (AMP-forming)/AMP-acid ligase II
MDFTPERNHAGALVPDLISCATLRYPERAAVIAGDATLSFSEVSDRASRLVSALHRRGITAGHRVGLLAMNDLEYLEIRVGAQRAGTILVPLNYRLAEAELAACLEDADVGILIVGRDLEEVAARMPVPAVLRLGAGAEAGDESYEAALAAVDPAPILPGGYDPETICHISYTSGTTARPKGVMLSNRSIHAGTMAMADELNQKPGAIFLACTPLFHVGSQVGFSCSYLGGTLVMAHKFEAHAFIDAIERHGVTHCQMVPTMIQMVLEAQGDRSIRSLERVLYGASPIPPALLRRAIEAWGCEFVNGYGSTESMGISFLTPAEHDLQRPHLLASVGRSSMLTTSRLVDDDGNDVAQGEIGEVLGRSAALMSGYWRNPQATAEALRDGWMHTGDLAYRDAEGYLYLVDRRDDKIVTGGENVFPSEIENVIGSHPGVHEAAVIGVPHEVWGEAVAAVVVLREGAVVTETDINAHCRGALAGYKVPKLIHFAADPLPRTATGKLLRRDLRDDWA